MKLGSGSGDCAGLAGVWRVEGGQEEGLRLCMTPEIYVESWIGAGYIITEPDVVVG